jgi:DNA-binding CsgD family transcriptional regulator
VDTARLLHLIELVYDCAVDPALWPSTLEAIAAALDSPAASINVLDLTTRGERTLVHAGIAPDAQARYHALFRGLNPFAHGMLLQPIDRPATSDELVTEAELLASRMYREWAAPQGFRHVMLTTLMRDQARLAFIGVTRRHDQPRYGEADKAAMARLAPHVRRAVTIADLIDHRGLERDDLAAALDAQATAILILDEGGRLVHANAAGRALVASGDLLTVRDGMVRPWDRAGAAAFQALAEGRGPDDVRLARRDGGHAILSGLPLGRGRRPGGAGRTALFIQGRAAAPNAAEIVGRTYRLTAAELRVLLGLAEGLTPQDIAGRWGIAPSTVRSQLRSLFVKTGTGRQSDLVTLLLAAPPVAFAAR